MNKKKITLSICLFHFMTTPIYALTEVEFVEHLLQHHEFSEEGELDKVQKSTEKMRQEFEDWKWDVSTDFGYSHLHDAREAHGDIPNYTIIREDQISAINTTLSRKFLDTGSSLNFRYENNRPVEDQINADGGYDRDVTEINSWSAGWTLPLLKNQSGALDQINYNIQVLEQQMQEMMLHNIREDYISEKLQLFLDWVFYDAQLKAFQQAFNTSNDLLAKLNQTDKDNQTQGTTEDSQALSFLVRLIKKEILDIQSQLKAKKEALSHVMTTRDNKKVNLDATTPIINWQLRIKPIYQEELQDYIKKNVRAVKMVELVILKNKVTQLARENSSLPDLNLVLSAARTITEGEYLETQNYDKSTADNYTLALSFSYPIWGGKSVDEQILQDTIQETQLKREYLNQLKEAAANISSTGMEISLIEAYLNNHERDIETDKKYLSDQLNAYLNDNNKPINSFINAQENYLKTVLNYNQKVINYHRKVINYNNLLDRIL